MRHGHGVHYPVGIQKRGATSPAAKTDLHFKVAGSYLLTLSLKLWLASLRLRPVRAAQAPLKGTRSFPCVVRTRINLVGLRRKVALRSFARSRNNLVDLPLVVFIDVIQLAATRRMGR